MCLSRKVGSMDIQIHSFHCDVHDGDIVVCGTFWDVEIDVCESPVADLAVDPNCRVEVTLLKLLNGPNSRNTLEMICYPRPIRRIL